MKDSQLSSGLFSKARLFVSVLAASLGGVLALPNSASAIPVTWSISGSFSDGGTFAGDLTYDADTNAMSAWNIAVAGGNQAIFPDFVYSNLITNSFLDLEDTDDQFIFCSTSNCMNYSDVPRRDLRLAFASPLTSAGGTNALLAGPAGAFPGYGLECWNCSPTRYIVSGTASTAPPVNVSEPGALALLGLSLVAFSAYKRRRTKA